MKRYLNFKIPPAQLTVLKTYYGWSTLSHDKRFIHTLATLILPLSTIMSSIKVTQYTFPLRDTNVKKKEIISWK